MIKRISSVNSTIKAGALAAMLAGSTALYASNPIKKDSQPNQTEVVSKEGANAIKATRTAEIKQASFPTEHNLDLDNALRKYIETEEDRKYIEGLIADVYKNNGTFLASAILQHEIDFQQLYTFVSKNTDILIKNDIDEYLGKLIKSFGPVFFKTLESNENLIMDKADEIHKRDLNQLLKFSKVPDALEVSNRISDIVEVSDFMSSEDKQRYYNKSAKYLERKGVAKSVKDKSDMIAREMFLMDKIIYTILLKKLGVFNENQYRNAQGSMQYYFGRWIDAVQPDSDID